MVSPLDYAADSQCRDGYALCSLLLTSVFLDLCFGKNKSSECFAVVAQGDVSGS